MSKRIILICSFVLLTNIITSQTTISGKLTDNDNNAVSNATVTLKSGKSKKIIVYDISDSDGTYSLEFIQDIPKFLINIRSMGFKTIEDTVFNKTQVQNFRLQDQEFELDEVVIKKPLIRVERDTINYAVNSFSKKMDRSIGDVLKRMPGIDIANNGTISYQGEPINNYYIEGLNLLDGKYNLANDNLPYDQVAEVQILENHQPIKLLDSLSFSDKPAINIKLKKNNTFTGSTEFGVGLAPILWQTNITPMLFSKKSQVLVSYQANNRGENLNTKNTKLTPNQFENENYSDQPWLSILELSPPNFPEERWLNNNDNLVSANFLQQLDKDYNLRLNISYFNRHKVEEGHTYTLFFTPSDSLSLSESVNNFFNVNTIHSNFTLKKNTKKNYFRNSLKFNGTWSNDKGIVKANRKRIEQKFSNNSYGLSNTLSTIFSLGPQLFTINSSTRFDQKTEFLNINPGQFEDSFNEGIPYENITQNLKLGVLKSSNDLRLSKDLGYFTISPKAEFEFEIKDLNTQLIKNENTLLGQGFINSISWIKTRTGLSIDNQFNKNDLQLALKAPIYLNSFNIENEFINKKSYLNKLTFEPSFSLNYRINNFWKIKAGTGISNSFGGLNQIYPSYMLNNYRSLMQFNSPVPETFTKKISGTIFYRNPTKLLLGNIHYSYQDITKNLLYDNRLKPNGAIEVNVKVIDNTRKRHNVTANINKYFTNINSSVTLTSKTNVQTFYLILNNFNSEIKNINQQVSGEIETNVTDFIDFNYNFSFNLSNSIIQNNENRKSKQESHHLGIDFNILESHFLGLKTEFIKNQFINTNTNDTFCDINYQFSYKNIDFNLEWSNIFNVKTYTSTIVTDYSVIGTSFNLRPSQLFIKVSFPL
ncbi:MAG: carboxypeptidase-like regulatory domain-containing protein [Salegentibacter mishustinae]|nr:carboxypeptidase-like regulatory domain-containing protein [Salegentibacter mishustinae]